MNSPDQTKPPASQRPGVLHRNDPTHKKGLRTVATIEFVKGAVAVVACVGVLALVHKDVWDVTEGLLEFLHINPDLHFAQVLLDWADRVTDAQLWTTAAVLFAYSILRFVEAYGLWKTRVWAEWVAILSGLLYLPFGVHALVRRSTLLRWGVVLVNLGLVAYVAHLRLSAHRQARRTAP